MKTLLTILNSKFIQSSLALRCLSTACDHQGVAVSVAEYTINQNSYDILRHIASFEADVIGFSCYIWNIEMTCHPIDLGETGLSPDQGLRRRPEVSYTARQILEDYEHIDYVLRCEGEEMVPAFLKPGSRPRWDRSPWRPRPRQRRHPGRRDLPGSRRPGQPAFSLRASGLPRTGPPHHVL